MVVWLRRILTTNKLYLRCTRSSKSRCAMGRKFRLATIVNALSVGEDMTGEGECGRDMTERSVGET